MALHDLPTQQQQQLRKNSAASENHVLQFLLGAAPLTITHGQKEANAASVAMDKAGRSETAARDDHGDTDSDLFDAPVLEYASENESEDDYIAFDAVVACGEPSAAPCSTSSSSEWEAPEQVAPEVLPALEDAPEAAATAAEGSLVLATLVLLKSGGGDAEKAVESHSDTASNCSDADGESSDDGESAAAGLLLREVEVGSTSSSSTRRNVSTKGNRRAEKSTSAADNVDSKRRDETDPEPDTHQQEAHDDRSAPERDVSSTEDEEDDSEEISQQSSPEGSPKKPKRLRTSATAPHVSTAAAPTPFEIAFVGSVALCLACYVVAVVYAFYHPIFEPLPLLESLQRPFDLSNVSVVITSPANHSPMEQPLYFEWQLAAYPVQAIREFGPDVFQYHIYVDSKRVISEIGLLNTSDAASASQEATTFNTTLRHRIAASYFPGYATYELLLEVTLPTPGNDGAVQTFRERVFVTKAIDLSRKLELLSPPSGAVFASGESVVIEYRAVNVKSLDVVVDGVWKFAKQHIGDGSLLLRGLSAGKHTIELVGLDASGRRVLSKSGERGAGAVATSIEVVS